MNIKDHYNTHRFAWAIFRDKYSDMEARLLKALFGGGTPHAPDDCVKCQTFIDGLVYRRITDTV
jgi:hypothetical protein